MAPFVLDELVEDQAASAGALGCGARVGVGDASVSAARFGARGRGFGDEGIGLREEEVAGGEEERENEWERARETPALGSAISPGGGHGGPIYRSGAGDAIERVSSSF